MCTPFTAELSEAFAFQPAQLLDSADLALIRGQSAQADQRGALDPEVLELAVQRRWWHLLTPGRLGGAGLDFPRTLYMEEALAWADGSLGWTATLLSGASWFAGFLHPSTRERLYSEAGLCLTGSGQLGTAELVDGGYVLEGCWPHASGIAHASHLTLNARICSKGRPLLDPEGLPLQRSFVVEASRAALLDNWPSMGLKATGSHGFCLRGCELGPEAAFDINRPDPGCPDPVFGIPFSLLAEATLAVNSSGLALGYLEAFSRAFPETASAWKDPAAADPGVRALWQFLEIRKHFFSLQQQAWTFWASRMPCTEDLSRSLSEASRRLAASARYAVFCLHPLSGLRGSSLADPLNRIFRDLFTASQHPLLRG